MATETPVLAPSVGWRKLHALGLPAGSIRALLAILIFATAWALLLLDPTREVPASLRDLLFIVMGHYFASRRRVEPGAVPGPPPLFLPRGSVRLVLIGGSLAVAVVLHRRGSLAAPEANPGVMTLLLVGGFLLGVALHSLADWWAARGHRSPRIVEDARALVSILAAAGLAFLVLNPALEVVVPSYVADNAAAAFLKSLIGLHIPPDQFLAAIVGFYFGSRS